MYKCELVGPSVCPSIGFGGFHHKIHSNLIMRLVGEHAMTKNRKKVARQKLMQVFNDSNNVWYTRVT